MNYKYYCLAIIIVSSYKEGEILAKCLKNINLGYSNNELLTQQDIINDLKTSAKGKAVYFIRYRSFDKKIYLTHYNGIIHIPKIVKNMIIKKIHLSFMSDDSPRFTNLLLNPYVFYALFSRHDEKEAKTILKKYASLQKYL